MKHVFIGVLTAFLILTSVSAYKVDLELWEDLGQITAYKNEFMICYFQNSTHTFWANYDTGKAEIFTENISMLYDIYCCDNCYFNADSLSLAPNSFQINVDNDLNISSDTNLNYYVGEELRIYRTILGQLQADQQQFDNMETVAGFIVILICTIVIPMFLTGLMPELGAKSIFAVGGALGYMVGLAIAGGFGLLSIPILSLFGLLGITFFISILGGLVRSG